MFHQPKTLQEALELKARHGAKLTAIAGGTDVIVLMNRGEPPPGNFLDLTHVEDFNKLQQVNGRYEMAGGTTYAQLRHLPVDVVSQAARSVGGPQIRNRGTIAGNLATASPAGDGSVALLALDADVTIAHASRGSRTVKLADYFVDYKKTLLGDDELITAVSIPADWTTAWYKIGKRGAVNISIVCAGISRSPDGRFCAAFGAVAPYPTRAPKTEALLKGHELTDELIDEAARTAMSETSPIDDHRGSAGYRLAMVGELTRRLLSNIRVKLQQGEVS